MQQRPVRGKPASSASSSSKVIQSPNAARPETALRLAAVTGDVEGLRAALEKCVHLDEPGDLGATALHYAASTGQAEIAKALLDAGASPNAALSTSDHSGQTPLHWAAATCQPRIVEILLLGGSDPTCRDQLGRTPFDLVRKESRDDMRFLKDAVELKRVLTVRAKVVEPTSLELTCTTLVGNVAATLCWPEDAPAVDLPKSIVAEIRKSRFTGLKEPLGPWNLVLVKPGPDASPLAVDRDSPSLKVQFGLVQSTDGHWGAWQ